MMCLRGCCVIIILCKIIYYDGELYIIYVIMYFVKREWVRFHRQHSKGGYRYCTGTVNAAQRSIDETLLKT